jgi:cyanophycinase
MKNLVLVGGAFSHKDLFDKFCALVGGNDKAKIGFITITSEGEEENGKFHVERCKHWGMDSQWVNITHNNKNSREVVKQLSECNIYYFTGGVQFRFRISKLQVEKDNAWLDSLALRTIRNRVNANQAVIVGTSAGAMIMQGRGTICNGESYQAYKYPVLNASEMKEAIDKNEDDYFNDQLMLDYDGGYNIFTRGMIDTHFSQRGREGRLIRALLETNYRFGFGIDEGTSLFVKEGQNQSVYECYGFNSIGVFSFQRNANVTRKNNPFFIKGVNYSLMQNGDVYYPHLNRFNFRNKKLLIPSKITGELVTFDAFTSYLNRNEFNVRDERSELRDLAISLCLSADQVIAKAYTYESPRIYVQLIKTSQTKAYIGKDGKVSFENLSISIMEQDK